jgi:WD40 repeat protein
MKNKKTNNKKSKVIFIIGFLGLMLLVIVQNLLREEVTLLSVAKNAGVTALETVENSLVSVFQDGQVVFWDWSEVAQQKGNFKVISDRVVLLDTQSLAAVSTTGKKILTVYSLPDGQKEKDISVGWDDQDVRLRISPDKKTVALIRQNAPDSKGSILFEFVTLNIENERIGSAVPLSIQQANEDFVDYALGNDKVLYAVGSKENRGWIAAVDIDKGAILWDTVFTDSKEYCTCLVSPGSSILYAGSRDGILYKLKADTGELLKMIQLLEDGETRPITNDYSVLNLAFSPDGQYFVATINPTVYIFEADSDEIIHNWKPADRLVSKIAFSPDNRCVATSDVRAGYPVKIWPMPEEN